MQRSFLSLTLLAGAWAFSSTAVVAQTTAAQAPTTEVPIRSTNTVSLPEQFIVSAKAGTINFIEGTVTSCRAKAPEAWRGVSLGDRLKTGDRLRTSSEGRAEILLNPGSYLRLDYDGEIVMTNPNLDALAVEVISGSALFEVTGTDGTELLLRILTPNGTVNIVRNGLYRVTVPREGAPTVAVIKGRITVEQAGRPLLVKDKQLVTLEATAVATTKLDKKDRDAFDEWSRNRAKTLRRSQRPPARPGRTGGVQRLAAEWRVWFRLCTLLRSLALRPPARQLYILSLLRLLELTLRLCLWHELGPAVGYVPPHTLQSSAAHCADEWSRYGCRTAGWKAGRTGRDTYRANGTR